MEPLAIVVGSGLALGTGLLVHVLLSMMVEMGRRLGSPVRRGRLQALGLTNKEQNETQNSEEALLGLDGIPWKSLYAGATLAAVLLVITLAQHLSTIRFGFLGLPGLVWLFRRYLIQQRKRFMSGQIRQFLVDVRLHMSLQGSLLRGLESIAQTTLESAAVYRCLKKCVRGGSARSGVDLLSQLAEDLKSPPLQRVVQRVKAAQQTGGIADIDRALAGVIDELNEEIGFQSEEQVQRLPLRITLLAMPLLLGPIVILLFYPLVDRILKTLAGVSVGGGF